MIQFYFYQLCNIFLFFIHYVTNYVLCLSIMLSLFGTCTVLIGYKIKALHTPLIKRDLEISDEVAKS